MKEPRIKTVKILQKYNIKYITTEAVKPKGKHYHNFLSYSRPKQHS